MAERCYLFRDAPPRLTLAPVPPFNRLAFINITIIKYTVEVVKIAWGCFHFTRAQKGFSLLCAEHIWEVFQTNLLQFDLLFAESYVDAN